MTTRKRRKRRRKRKKYFLAEKEKIRSFFIIAQEYKKGTFSRPLTKRICGRPKVIVNNDKNT